MEPDPPPIDLSAGGGKLVYDKARRTIVSVPPKGDKPIEKPLLDLITNAGE